MLNFGHIRSKFSEAAVLNDRKADVERKLQHLQHQVDQLTKKTTELERDRCKCRDMKTLFGRLESKAVNVRHTTQRLEFSLVGAKAATTYRLVKIRSARTQVNALQYVDTRERIIEILDHIAHEIRGGFVSDQSSKSWFTRLFENPYAELLYDGWFGTVSRPKRIDEFEEHRKLADGLKRIRACTPKVLKIQDQIAEASGLGCGDKRHANTFEFILPLRCTRMLGLAENFWVRFVAICGGLLLLGWIKPATVIISANILTMLVKLSARTLIVLVQQTSKFLVAVALVSVDLLVKLLVMVSIVGELTLMLLVSVAEIMAAMLSMLGIYFVNALLWVVCEIAKRMAELVVYILAGMIHGLLVAVGYLALLVATYLFLVLLVVIYFKLL